MSSHVHHSVYISCSKKSERNHERKCWWRVCVPASCSCWGVLFIGAAAAAATGRGSTRAAASPRPTAACQPKPRQAVCTGVLLAWCRQYLAAHPCLGGHRSVVAPPLSAHLPCAAVSDATLDPALFRADATHCNCTQTKKNSAPLSVYDPVVSKAKWKTS